MKRSLPTQLLNFCKIEILGLLTASINKKLCLFFLISCDPKQGIMVKELCQFSTNLFHE